MIDVAGILVIPLKQNLKTENTNEE